jgi:hypothetical protein
MLVGWVGGQTLLSGGGWVGGVGVGLDKCLRFRWRVIFCGGCSGFGMIFLWVLLFIFSSLLAIGLLLIIAVFGSFLALIPKCFQDSYFTIQ